MKVSILIPVYNVQPFLPKCIESVLGQTFQDFELILVDDGSTDESGAICDKYATLDKRIHAFHQPNSGIGRTRAFALSQACGEFIMWVDSDDWIRTDAVELLYNKALEDGADIVRYWLEIVYKDSSKQITPRYDTNESLLRDTLASQWASLCLTFTRKKLIEENKISFPDSINNGEDYYFVNASILKAGKISYINEVLYFYNRLNFSSTIATPSIEKTMEQIEATRLIISILKENREYQKYRKEINFRKFVAKEPLWVQCRRKWFLIFPEVSYLMLKAWIGKLITKF